MPKSDEGHKLTEKQLANLERRIAKLYREAGKELQATIDAYFEQFKKRDEEMKALIGTVQNGKEWTEADYKQWRLNQIGRGERYQAMRDKVAQRATEANAVAVSYTNDSTPGIYSLNRNYAAYTIEQVAGNVGFDLWDEQTVKRIMIEQPDLMPYYPPKRALKRGIDLEYGKKQITKSITSSILQGKSIKHMADDLQRRITDMSRDSAIRTARTAVTGAQNAGRMDSYAAAEKMGIKLKKEWLATLDSRTRHSHAMLDGQKVDPDKPFKVDGYEIMFPGDTSAPGYLVYNCRCTLIAAVDGVDTSDALRRDRDGLMPDMTFAQWENTKRGEGAIAAERYTKKAAERETKDRKQYAEYKAVLGKNAPKTFGEFKDLKYNSGEWENFKPYKRAVQTGELTALADFSLYQETSMEIDDKLVGLTTSNGITITGKSNHFISRVIGSVEQRRSGVDIQAVAEALTYQEADVHPIKIYKDGSTSQKFRHGGVEVTVNPNTGNLIQTNPKAKKGVVKYD